MAENYLPGQRLGYHYYPDTHHYRERDLEIWLPVLQSLGAKWVTLIAPTNRAIPEFFINALLQTGINPVLHFPLPVDSVKNLDSLKLLFKNYARWGIQYVTLFDRPNNRSSWTKAGWAQSDLVERFLDNFLPLAKDASNVGLSPVFPPLEPGGDYWDTAFIRTALRCIQRRDQSNILDSLVLGLFAFAGNRPVNWGAGGPGRWPGARPYVTPAGNQDQLGFHIFDWYIDIARQELGKPLPIILLRAGSNPGDNTDHSYPPVDEASHANINLELAHLISNDYSDEGHAGALPSEVLAGNFWLLAAEKSSQYVSQAWFQPQGRRLPVVDAFRKWVADYQVIADHTVIFKQSVEKTSQVETADPHTSHPIPHYLLLPVYAWGVAQWDLEAVKPLIHKHRPTIGFSLSEALLASRVTVVGSKNAISDKAIQMLRDAGCQVERLMDDGMLIAS